MSRRSRPNILVVFADQLRGSSLGHVGQETVVTPNLDRLASDGHRLTRAVANCPLCCPMRASMITGQHPLSHGVIGNDIRLREDAPSIGRALSGVGYRTAYIGKWHLDGPDRTAFTPPGPRRHGFDHWAACNCNHLYYEAYYYRDDPEPIWIEGYEPTAQTDLAMDWIAAASRESDPWCLWLSWGPPHCPYDHVPERFLAMYDPDAIRLRPNVTQADRRMLAGYYAHVTALDWNFGRLMEALNRLGLEEETLVIFTSDHGDMLFSHNRGWKSKPWAESVIVPFIVRWPGVVPRGSSAGGPFGLVNLAPTLCAIAGAPVPSDMEGEPLPELVLGQRSGAGPASTPIYLYLPAVPQSFPMWRGVVTERHTYARFRDRAWVLFDDICDPYQLSNLADSPGAASLQDEMERELTAWLRRLDDDFATADDLCRRRKIVASKDCIPVIVQQETIVAEQRRRAATRAERMRDPGP